MAYTNTQVRGGVALAVVGIMGAVAAAMKVARVVKQNKLQKSQVPVSMEGQLDELPQQKMQVPVHAPVSVESVVNHQAKVMQDNLVPGQDKA